MAIGRINASLSGVQPGGLAKIVPTSVAVGSGSGSVDSNGNVTFSGASSVSLNGCFNSSYDNYRIIFSGEGSTATLTSLLARMRASGTDKSDADYYRYEQARSDSAGSNAYSGSNTSFKTGALASLKVLTTIDISYPQVNDYTNLVGLSQAIGPSQSNQENFGGYHNVVASYDGISFIANSGTISGTIRVYGYAQ